jgi:hypothetical protein
MGPAFLPTPLSPACGCAATARISGEPSILPAAAHAWRPMSSLSLPCLATGLARDLSPALAPASGFRSCGPASAVRPKPSDVRRQRIRLAEAASLYRSRAARLGGFRRSARLPLGQVLGLSGATAFRSLPSASRLAFGRSLLHAVSGWARGQMSPPSLGLKAAQLQGLSAFGPPCFVSRRQVETAPESAI